MVSISGDGTGATAVAQIDSGGNLTGILVTCPGVNYTYASVSLNGGGGSGNGGTANLGANATTGGLTKLGSGTLTLSGTNSYGGATMVSNGTLVFGKAHAAPGNVAVADGATLGCWSDTPGESVHLPSATLGVTTGAGLLAQFTGTTRQSQQSRRLHHQPHFDWHDRHQRFVQRYPGRHYSALSILNA